MDAHSNNSTLLLVLRCHGSARGALIVAGYGTGCAHVETATGENFEIGGRRSKRHCRSPRSVPAATDHVPVRLLEGPATTLGPRPPPPHFENKHEWVRANLNDIKQEILSYAGA